MAARFPVRAWRWVHERIVYDEALRAALLDVLVNTPQAHEPAWRERRVVQALPAIKQEERAANWRADLVLLLEHARRTRALIALLRHLLATAEPDEAPALAGALRGIRRRSWFLPALFLVAAAGICAGLAGAVLGYRQWNAPELLLVGSGNVHHYLQRNPETRDQYRSFRELKGVHVLSTGSETALSLLMHGNDSTRTSATSDGRIELLAMSTSRLACCELPSGNASNTGPSFFFIQVGAIPMRAWARPELPRVEFGGDHSQACDAGCAPSTAVVAAYDALPGEDKARFYLPGPTSSTRMLFLSVTGIDITGRPPNHFAQECWEFEDVRRSPGDFLMVGGILAPCEHDGEPPPGQCLCSGDGGATRAVPIPLYLFGRLSNVTRNDRGQVLAEFPAQTWRFLTSLNLRTPEGGRGSRTVRLSSESARCRLYECPIGAGACGPQPEHDVPCARGDARAPSHDAGAPDAADAAMTDVGTRRAGDAGSRRRDASLDGV